MLALFKLTSLSYRFKQYEKQDDTLFSIILHKPWFSVHILRNCRSKRVGNRNNLCSYKKYAGSNCLKLHIFISMDRISLTVIQEFTHATHLKAFK